MHLMQSCETTGNPAEILLIIQARIWNECGLQDLNRMDFAKLKKTLGS